MPLNGSSKETHNHKNKPKLFISYLINFPPNALPATTFSSITPQPQPHCQHNKAPGLLGSLTPTTELRHAGLKMPMLELVLIYDETCMTMDSVVLQFLVHARTGLWLALATHH